jgi:hypothetical protein
LEYADFDEVLRRADILTHLQLFRRQSPERGDRRTRRPWRRIAQALALAATLAVLLSCRSTDTRPAPPELRISRVTTVAAGGGRDAVVELETANVTLGDGPAEGLHRGVIAYFLDVPIRVEGNSKVQPIEGRIVLSEERSYRWTALGPGPHLFGAQVLRADSTTFSPPAMDMLMVPEGEHVGTHVALRLELRSREFFPSVIRVPAGSWVTVAFVSAAARPRNLVLLSPDGEQTLLRGDPVQEAGYYRFRAPDRPGRYRFRTDRTRGPEGELVVEAE